MPREGGASSTPRRREEGGDAGEYWIVRFRGR
jgi:hypothetical protein